MKKAAVLALALPAPLVAVAGKKKLPSPAPLPSQVEHSVRLHEKRACEGGRIDVVNLFYLKAGV